MLRIEELKRETPLSPGGPTGVEVWEAVCAADSGDASLLKLLVERNPLLARGDFYTAPLHFAAREGHQDAVLVLLASGQDADSLGLSEELVELRAVLERNDGADAREALAAGRCVL